MNFLEHKTPRSDDFVVLCTAFSFCVHRQILILHRNQLFLVMNILMLKRKSAKNIRDELEVHKLFPLLTTGKRRGCAAAMAVRSSEVSTRAVLESPRITSPAPAAATR